MMRLLIPLLALVVACSDPVEIDSAFEASQPAVDAWLTDEARPQTINLWMTQDYFANTAPPPLTGAQVQLVGMTADSSVILDFVELSPGAYTWTPTADVASLIDGDSVYRLVITADLDGEQRRFEANSNFKRVPLIDSISVQFEEQAIGLDEGLYAQLYARDLQGLGDRYLIRSTINDTLLNRRGELNLAADASFDSGTPTDGIAFIFPIRLGINKTDDDGALVPLEPGDSIRAEVWSLTQEAFRFLSDAQEQLQNADAQLFTVPVVSTRGNVRDADRAEAVLGMFSLSRVSVAEKEVE